MKITVLSREMIITCNSCQKSFNVPDSAIGTKGRLVQCSACNNKWTQYPIKVENIKLKPVQEEIKAKTIAKVKRNQNQEKKNKKYCKSILY